jgi:hypothetical protein
VLSSGIFKLQRGAQVELTRHSRALTVGSLLLFMAMLAGGGARRESVTIDEVAHTAAGVSYLEKLDMRMNEEHPPLAKLLAALPLVLKGVHADYTHISWTFSLQMFHQYLGEWVFGHWFLMRWNDPHSIMLWARIPMLLVTLLLGYLVYALASRLGGDWGGMLCLALYVSMPPFLAFGPLVITDMLITLFWVLTVWLLADMWHSPSSGSILKFALAFAGALLSKFSSGLLLFVFLAVILSLRLRPVPEQPASKPERKLWRKRARRNILKATLLAALLVYVVYFVLSWNQPTSSFDMIPHFPASPLVRRMLMPAWVFLRGLMGFVMSAGSRPTYILGHSYPHGVWFYFPVIFALKTPLAFLLTIVLTAVSAVALKMRGAVSPIPKDRELHWRCLWISLMIFTAACMANRLDLSIRHFSVAIVLIILLLAPLPRMLASLSHAYPRAARFAAVTALALTSAAIITAIRTYPNYFPFLNSLKFGRPGYELVNDSNLDWNHALPQVETFVQQHGLKRILLDEYGFSEPQSYVPQAVDWSCQQPAPGDAGQWAIVSANNIADGHNCRWLLKYPMLPLAAGSMYALELPASIPAAGSIGGPPLPADYRSIGGGPPGFDIKQIFLACIRDPHQLEPTMDRMIAMSQSYRKQKK